MKIKKTFLSAFVLCALLLSIMSVPALAGAMSETRLLSISDLAATTPQVWQQTYNNKAGTNIPINVDIDVPKVTLFPVLQVVEGNRQFVPTSSLPETLVVYPSVSPGAFAVFLDAPNGIWNTKGEKMNKPEWKNASTQNTYWFRPWDFDRSYADQNSLKLEEANSFFQHRIEQITNNAVNYSLDLLTTKGVYQVESWKGQVPKLGRLIGDGFYSMRYTQNLMGIPVLGSAARIGISDGFKGDIPSCPTPGSAEVSIAASDEYYIAATANEVLAVLYEDVPLCSFEIIRTNIERLIDLGHLRHISSLRLGYVLFADSSNSSQGISVPTWVLKGDWYEKSNDKTPWYHHFTSLNDGYIGYHAMYATEIMFNAQTGEVLRGFTKPSQLYAPEIVTWNTGK